MKKIYFFLVAALLLGSQMLVNAEPYGLLVNGTTVIEAVPQSETDHQGRQQFLVSCVALEQGDEVQLTDLSNGAAWMSDVDPYGEYQKFTGGKAENKLTCNEAGNYDFYIKLKFEDDLVYIGPGTNCGVSFDPAANYYITGNAELVGGNGWGANEITMTADEATSTWSYTFTNLADGQEYKMKITNGTWDLNWGFNALQQVPEGVYGDSDGNIVFQLEKKGDVAVTFTGSAIKLAGEFKKTGNIVSGDAVSVPMACPDVMLQGFYWDSNQDKQFGNTRWSTLQAQATEISAYFDLIWLPPSAKSTGGVGYLPAQYSNQNSAWGSRVELEKLIQTLHDGGTKVIADMVVNHMSNKSSWCDFNEQNFGAYGSFSPDASWICSTDEINSDSSAGGCYGAATGPSDDGYGGESNYGAARDLAHQKDEVRQMCRAYAKWMVEEMKYDGFRYDYCKGFHNSHVSDYNKAAGAYFSVMEYWDGNANTLWSRIQDAECNTLTFDFSVKYNALNDGIAQGRYGACKGAGLLGLGKGKYSVTFVDNHDTYQRDNGSEYKGDILQANAYILSMPGVPCVFYPHWKQHKAAIGAMILARKAVGVHSESAVSDEADNGGYRAFVTGFNGTLILELGNKVSGSQAGYTKAASGNGYAIWIKTSAAVAPTLIVSPGTTTYKTESLKVEMQVIGATGTSTIYYTLDGSDPKKSTSKQTYSAPLTITGTVTLKAYAVANGTETEVQTYTYTYLAPQETPLTVRFMPPTSWEKVYLYAWDANGTILGSWPGTEWLTKDKEGWLYYMFDASLREVNVIFTNGAGVQSSDILLDRDACYTWDEANGVELLSEECGAMEVDFQLIVTPQSTTYKTETLTIEMKTIGNTDEATIYYTLDGTDPLGSSTVLTYTAPFAIKGNVTLSAYAVADGVETAVQTHSYVYQEPQQTPLVVKFFPPESWTVVNLYAWDMQSEPLLGAWPGMEWTTKDENGWLYYTFEAGLKEVNVIFNNGSVQSADLYVDEDVCYIWDEDLQKAVIDPECSGSDVENVFVPGSIPALDVTQPMFNVLGQQVTVDYHGVVIQNGYKYIR